MKIKKINVNDLIGRFDSHGNVSSITHERRPMQLSTLTLKNKQKRGEFKTPPAPRVCGVINLCSVIKTA